MTKMDVETEDAQYCDICFNRVTDNRNSTKLNSIFVRQDEVESKELNVQLLWYFILRKVLKVNDPSLLETLCQVSSKRTSSIGNPATTDIDLDNAPALNSLEGTRFCSYCEDLVFKGWKIHKQMKNLKRQLLEIGEILRKTVISSQEENRHLKLKQTNYSNSVTKKLYAVINPSFDGIDIKKETVDCDNDSDHNFDPHFPIEKLEIDFTDGVTPVVEQGNDDNTSRRKSGSEPDSSSEHDDPSYSIDNSKISTNRPANRRRKVVRGNKTSAVTIAASLASKLPLPKGQTRFQCDICKMVQNTRHGFRQHMITHEQSTRLHGNKYDCPHCKYPALSEFKLRNHLTRSHSDKNQRNTCTICGYVGARRWLYDKHMREKHNIEVWKPLDADVKNQDASNQDENLSDHTYSGAGTSSKSFACDKCSAIYKTLRGFENHQEDHKTSERLNHKFDCDTCKYPANSEKLLRYHKLRKHKEVLMRTCKLCGHQVRRLDQMKLHMKNKHGMKDQIEEKENPDEVVTVVKKKSKWMKHKTGNRFRCDICKYTYADSGALKRHMGEHEKCKELGSKWECSVCKFPCTSEESFQRHFKMRHDKQAKIVHTCKVCSKTFARRYLLTTHMIMHKRHEQSFNPETGQFACPSCPAMYTSLAGVMVHQVHAHPYDNPIPAGADPVEGKSYLCSACGRSFTNAMSLRKHVRIKHDGRHLNTCDICGLGVEGKKKLERHRQSHSDQTVKEFVCEVCGAGYTTKFSLNKHVNKVHPPDGAIREGGKTYRCKFCEAVFSFKCYLEKHMNTEHQDKYTFKCDMCEKSYISASSLRLHKDISHSNPSSSGTTPHTCEYCGKEFAHRHYVLCHYKCCPVKKTHKTEKSQAPTQRQS